MRFTAKIALLASGALVAGLTVSATATTASATPSTTGLSHRKEFGTYDAAKTAKAGGGATSSKTLYYGGGIDNIGVTSGGNPKVYLVFWGDQWGSSSTDVNGNLKFSTDTLGATPRLQQLFKGLGANNEGWSRVMAQYCDGPNVASGAKSCPSNANFVPYPVNGVLAGVWYDNASTAPTAPPQSQIAAEALAASSHFGNVDAASNRQAQYVILSAPGMNPDNYTTSGFCAWHDYTTSVNGDLAYTNMPYVMDRGTSCGANFVNSGTAGKTDGYTIVEGHEYSETITDQNPVGGWLAHSGQENADECAWISPLKPGGAGNVNFGSFGSYPLQGTWSNADNACKLTR